MIRVLEVILLGGGSIGALSGWLLCKWLDARTERIRRMRPAWHGPVGIAKHDAAAGERLAIELTPPATRPSPAADFRAAVGRISSDGCGFRKGDHLCHLPAAHDGPHVCTCPAAPTAHLFD